MANSFRVVNFGDSVQWGQGLLETEKYDVLVVNALRPKYPDITLERFSHSGATIGLHPATGNPEPGEVPAAAPTILKQCDDFANAPQDVDVVLLDGGINDVGVTTILNPFAIVPSLHSRIVAACHDAMLVLLKKISAKFTKSTCRIIVSGYYPILSPKSDPVHIPKLLQIHGIAAPDFINEADFFSAVVDRCELFFNDSTALFQRAIADAGDARIKYVSPGFTDENALFVPGTSLLFGLDDLLNPVDPVAAQRHAECDLVYPTLLQIADREHCYRASVGHPNPQGAAQYAKQILASPNGG